MRDLLWWSWGFPAQLCSSLLQQERCQRQYWRSSLFYGARVCLSPAPLPDKLARLSRRGCADGISLWHDSCPAGFELLRQTCAHLDADGRSLAWQHCLTRCQRICQDSLVELGRAWSHC
ncbi:hypothetical protein [Chromobacterium sp. IIBBL 290-4]|uniref:hypothetical protein n=1 Tax=Chromobacterium sp. IIBBL 290-4 TaxID=2953890 RepID=UPI0020B849EC|nr:hypothetical protein [Chromobacterium sp. IIBBL 290-4]UTH76485.1 hypothetical protein NKT35_10445 [Chromobacterium sp. IIBBL 290-4]